MLLYSMGSKRDDILATFGLTNDDSKKFDVVKDKFDGYFVKRRNIMHERAKCNRGKQETGEPDSLIYMALLNTVSLVCYTMK